MASLEVVESLFLTHLKEKAVSQCKNFLHDILMCKGQFSQADHSLRFIGETLIHSESLFLLSVSDMDGLLNWPTTHRLKGPGGCWARVSV